MAKTGGQKQIINIILENAMKTSTVMKSKYKTETEKSEENHTEENVKKTYSKREDKYTRKRG